MSSTVAIVTVSFNSGKYLDEFLASAARASSPSAATPAESPSAPIIVVADNDSRDPDAARRSTEAVGGVFLELGSNDGYGSAINRAVETLPREVDWILISNPDVILGEGAVDTLLEVALSGDRVGAVGPGILELDGQFYPSARRVPSLRTGLGHALFANVWKSNPWSRSYRSDGDHENRREAGWLSGACLLVRRSLFDSLGGFDEGYFMYFEDVDLGYRIGKAGFTNVYEPRARVTHVGAHSTRESSDLMRRAHHRSAYRFLASKYRAWYLAPLRWALRVGLGIRARIHGRPTP